MASLLSLPFDDRYVVPTMSPQQQRQQTLDTLVGWLLEETERQPVMAAILNVLTFRPDFEPPWISRSQMTPITLNRLERPQVEALITHRAGGKALPAEVVEHIVAKTDGVPLYVEELTRMLLDSELLREEAGQYALTGPLLTVAIPDTLQAVLQEAFEGIEKTGERFWESELYRLQGELLRIADCGLRN